MIFRVLLKCLAAFLFLLSMTSSHVFAGIMHDSSLEWSSMESAHFRIHFHDGEQAMAEESLNIAERIHQRIAPVLEWEPKEKTEIVLSDETDSSNGFATPLPSNRMTIFASAPASVNSLEDHHGWLEMVILHEYVHILHLDKDRGSAEELRDSFGRMFLLFPNMFMPPWMLEGLATFHETDVQEGIGRGQSSYFEMMMRLEVQSGMKGIGQINQPMVSWPLLNSRYLYGVYFYQFLVDTYGQEVIKRLLESYSDHLMPFRINDLYEDVLGKDLRIVWPEFQNYLQERFAFQIEDLSQLADEGERLTSTGDYKRSLKVAGDGSLYYVSDHMAEGSALMQLKQDGSSNKLAGLSFGARLDWHESSGLLVMQPDWCNNANRYFDLYRVDESSGGQTRLTQCARYIMATWSADGSEIYAVKNERGQHALHQLDQTGQLKKVLWKGRDGETISSLDAADDGKAVVVSIWYKQSGWNIAEFDLSAMKWRKRTMDSRVKTDVSYLHGSRDILFSMEQDGVYKLFVLNVKGEVSQLSHAFGGMFSPVQGKDGSLYSINYHENGFDLHHLPKVQSKRVKAQDVFAEEHGRTEPAFAEIVISKPVPYEPWSTLAPTSWFPYFVFSNHGMELGAFVNGMDALNRHSYNVYAGYQEITSTPVFTLDYTYDRWFPLLSVRAQQMELPSLDSQSEVIALTQDKRLETQLIFPWISESQRLSLHLGFNDMERQLSWLAPGYISNGYHERDSVSGVAMVYDQRDARVRAISPVSDGRIWSLQLESGKGLGGDYPGSVAILSGREYFDLSSEQVLAMRIDIARGDNSSRPFYLGGAKILNVTPYVTNPLTAVTQFNRRGYALRGYGEGEAQLRGQNMELVSLEYRFPIARIEDGGMTPPVGVQHFFGQIFVDAGHTWSSSFDQKKTYTGAGAELGADITLFYSIPFQAQLGYARGLDERLGGDQWYFRIGTSF